MIKPDVAVKLSIKSFCAAKKIYNEKHKKQFNKTPKEQLFPNLTPENLAKKKKYENLSQVELKELSESKLAKKTVNSLLLQDIHFQLYIVLLNYYRDKIINLSSFFNGSANLMTHILPKASMRMKTGQLAAHLGRANNTIRARLRRLEDAGIIRVVFHGNKKPLEIVFNKNICIIYDKTCPEQLPESNFLTSCESVFSDRNDTIANNKKGLITNTIYNNTITKDVSHSVSNQCSISALNDSATNKPPQILNDGIQNFFNKTKTKQNTTKTPNTTRTNPLTKKEISKEKRTVGDIRNENLEKLKQKAALKQMNKSEKKDFCCEKRKKERQKHLKNLEQRRKEAKIHYSLIFYGYLIENLFADKYLTPDYRKETLNYIYQHYFSRAKNIEHAKRLWHDNYKKRIDISRMWIHKFRSPEGKKFDTTFFYPKAYIDTDRRGKKILSFANTEKFLIQANEWEKNNGYNRRCDDDTRHKLNKIAREIENGFINYDDALEKVKSLTNDTDEYVKQLNARYFGMYKLMPKN